MRNFNLAIDICPPWLEAGLNFVICLWGYSTEVILIFGDAWNFVARNLSPIVNPTD
jgi:hypothetical protein